MTKELFYEDVEVGTEIPPLMKTATIEQLVRWAAATGNFGRIHYDTGLAKSTGLSGPSINGGLKFAWLGQLLSDWVGESGTIKSYGCSHRGIEFPGDTITYKGMVVRKNVEGDENRVECEIWSESVRGKKTTQGNAVVVLPSKTSS